MLIRILAMDAVCLFASLIYFAGIAFQLAKNKKDNSADGLSFPSLLSHSICCLAFFIYEVLSGDSVFLGIIAAIVLTSDLLLIFQYCHLLKESKLRRLFLGFFTLFNYSMFVPILIMMPFGPLTFRFFQYLSFLMSVIMGFPQIYQNAQRLSTAFQAPQTIFLSSLSYSLTLLLLPILVPGPNSILFGISLYFPTCTSFINIMQFAIFYQDKEVYRNKVVFLIAALVTEFLLVIATLLLCFSIGSFEGYILFFLFNLVVFSNIGILYKKTQKKIEKFDLSIEHFSPVIQQSSFVTHESA